MAAHQAGKPLPTNLPGAKELQKMAEGVTEEDEEDSDDDVPELVDNFESAALAENVD